jgi:hypothetical protein
MLPWSPPFGVIPDRRCIWAIDTHLETAPLAVPDSSEFVPKRVLIGELIPYSPVKASEIVYFVSEERPSACVLREAPQDALSAFAIRAVGGLPAKTETDSINDRIGAAGTLEHLIEFDGTGRVFPV